MKLALIGFGTVGRGAYDILKDRQEVFEKTIGPMEIAYVVASDRSRNTLELEIDEPVVTAKEYDKVLEEVDCVAEATGANVFFVQNGALHTPRVDHILDGITRQTVIEMAQAKGIEVVIRDILPEELSDFSECFLTGSAAEVTPVSEIGDYRFTPGELSLSLMDDYGKLVRGQL